MAAILTRSVIFFVALNVVMRFLGKRQMGEMELTDFVTTIMLSELAVFPVTNPQTPISHGLAGMALMAGLEFASSYISRKSTGARSFIDGKPLILLAKGRVIEKNLTRSRISTDELFAAMRKEGYRGVEDVEYIILEQTGAISVIPRGEEGVSHAVVVDGTVRKRALSAAGKDERWLAAQMKQKGLKPKELLYFTVNDKNETHYEKKL